MSLSQTVRPNTLSSSIFVLHRDKTACGRGERARSDLAVVNNRSDEGPTLETSAFKLRNLIGKQS